MSTRTNTRLSVTSITGGLIREIVHIFAAGYVAGIFTLPVLYVAWMILTASASAH